MVNTLMATLRGHDKLPLVKPTLNPKKTKLKLVKMVKREPRKASFPWNLGLIFGKPMRYEIIAIFYLLKYKHKYNACKLRILFKLLCKTDDFPKLDLECFMKFFRNEM